MGLSGKAGNRLRIAAIRLFRTSLDLGQAHFLLDYRFDLDIGP